MDNTKRLMGLDFSRYMLRRLGGFTKELLIDILKELPKETEVRAFVEHMNKDCYSILLSHDSFPEVEDGCIIPTLIAYMNQHHQPDGSFTTSVELKWPDSFKANHECQYKTYQGFSKTEEICTICGKVK